MASAASVQAQRRRSADSELRPSERASFGSGALNRGPSFRQSLDGGLKAEGDLQDTIEEGQQDLEDTW
jgi:hypothetical protein